jgi:DNA-binding MarR family transcriptional regulator
MQVLWVHRTTLDRPGKQDNQRLKFTVVERRRRSMKVEMEAGTGAVSGQEDRTKPDVAVLTRNISHLLRLARLRLANIMERQLLEQLGVTNMQATLLFLISGGESASLKTLAQSSGIEMARASRLLTMLEERGLVTRVRSGSDRRVTELQLTAAGYSLANRLPMILRKVADAALSTFDEAKKAVLMDMLADLIGNCELIERQSVGRSSDGVRAGSDECWTDSLGFVELQGSP